MQATVLAIALPASCVMSEPPITRPDAAPVGQVATDFYARLHDEAGPVSGLTGYTTTLIPDAMFCGGFRIEVSAGRAPVGEDELPLADMIALEFPRDLDFSPGHEQAAGNALLGFLQRASTLRERAHARYEGVAANGTDRERLEALARDAQLARRFASTFARAAIPVEVTTGDLAEDKTQAYCDAVRSGAGQLADRADELTRRCAEQIEQLHQHGWWDDVCL
jgi:hypothetical protein